MSSDGTGKRGATNHLGQLFTGEGADIYEGLVCIDGSVIPTALGEVQLLVHMRNEGADVSPGVNPFATITALAERSVDYLAQKHGCAISTTANGKLDLFGKSAKSFPMTDDMADMNKAMQIRNPSESGIRSTEVMEGHIYIGNDIDDFVVAENVAKGSSSSAKFYLSVDAYNMKSCECCFLSQEQC